MAEAIRVLISDEEPDSRVAVRRALQRAGLEIAGEAGFGTAAVSLAGETRPDVVLISVEEPVTRALDTAEGMANVLPATPIIVYSTMSEAQAVRRAMVFGARDYLVKPVQAEALREAVYRALAQEERRQMRQAGALSDLTQRGTIIAVVGAKGGIGKSVLSANLALAIRRQTGSPVCVVDADANFGDIATLFNQAAGVDLERLLGELDRVDRDYLARVLVEGPEGVRILSANKDEAWHHCSDDAWHRLVDMLAQVHDYVVIDTSGSFDHVTQLAMERATLSLLVTSGEVSSIRGTAGALRRIRGWGIEPDRVRIVLNRTTDKRMHVTSRDIEDGLGTPVFFNIPYDPDVVESVQLGQPALLRANSRFGKSVDRLAGLITGRGDVVSATQRSDAQSVLRRLFNIRGRNDDAGMAPVPELPDQQ